MLVGAGDTEVGGALFGVGGGVSEGVGVSLNDGKVGVVLFEADLLALDFPSVRSCRLTLLW